MILLIGILAGELFARYYLGLGDPPITVTHPTIEYLFAPNQHVRRFGNQIDINSYSMRAADFPRAKQNANELRILLLGDSIINGGALTDQDELATELLRRHLAEALDRPVVVGNISAGSWGPPNLLAYVKEFGTFDADFAVLVLSSHDAADLPTFEPLDRNLIPQAKPAGALWEAVTRYLPRYLPGGSGASEEPAPVVSNSNRTAGLAATRALVETFRKAGAKVIVLLHQTRNELATRPEAEHEMLRVVCGQAGAKVLELGTAFQESIDRGADPYRDGLHPNALGQRVIYEVLRQAVVESVGR
jgi:lysophospholipase L1-like esterase